MLSTKAVISGLVRFEAVDYDPAKQIDPKYTDVPTKTEYHWAVTGVKQLKNPIRYRGGLKFVPLKDKNVLAILNNEDSFFSDENRPKLPGLSMIDDSNSFVMKEEKETEIESCSDEIDLKECDKMVGQSVLTDAQERILAQMDEDEALMQMSVDALEQDESENSEGSSDDYNVCHMCIELDKNGHTKWVRYVRNHCHFHASNVLFSKIDVRFANSKVAVCVWNYQVTGTLLGFVWIVCMYVVFLSCVLVLYFI